MKALHHRGLACVVAALGLFAVVPVHARSFEPVAQARWVIIGGSATVQGQNGETRFVTDFHYQPLLPETNFSPYDVTDNFLLDVAAPDNTAAVHLQGSVSQQSSIGPEAIRFEGSFAASATASGSPGPQSSANLSGGRGSFLGEFFEVPAPVTAVLTLHAAVTGGAFAFEFLLLNETLGNVAWSEAASDNAPGGRIIPEHQVTLNLKAVVDGHVFLNEQGSASGGFSLVASAIPEPQAWLLLVAGMPLLGVVVKRARRSGAA